MFIWQNKEVKTIVVQNILEMILTPSPPQKKIPIKNKRLIMTQLDILEEASHPKPKIFRSPDNGAPPRPQSLTVGEAWDTGGWDSTRPIKWDT